MPTVNNKCTQLLSTHLQDDGWSRLQLQHARHAKRLKLRVGIVDEVGVVECHQRLNVIQFEAELIGSFGHLLMSGQTDGQLGRLAQHGRLTDDLTQLHANTGGRERKDLRANIAFDFFGQLGSSQTPWRFSIFYGIRLNITLWPLGAQFKILSFLKCKENPVGVKSGFDVRRFGEVFPFLH